MITSYPTSPFIFKESQNVRLPCVASGVPAPSYVWTKDGAELEMSDRITRPNPDEGTIQIAAANKYQDNGIYQCRAINQHGTAFTGMISLNQSELTYDTPTDPLQETRDEGESLKLVLHNSVTSVPQSSYEWKIVQGAQLGTPLSTSTRIGLDQSTGSLYFANLLTSDQPDPDHIYKLDVTNAFVDITAGGSPYELIVTSNPGKQDRPPNRMVPEVEDFTYTALKGKDATIKCFFGGLPTPLITWRPPTGGPPPNRIDCTKESNTECLIRAVEYSDEGIYTCTGRNSQGSLPADINFVVDSVPTFITAPGSRNVTVGHGDSFICKPDAKPAAEITWYSNGREISRDNPGSNRIIISQDHTNLTVTQVCKDCEGEPSTDLQVFQCKISNIHGEAYASAYLNVLEPIVIYDQGENPDVVVDPDRGDRLETNFTCKATTDDLVQDELEIAWWHDGERLYNGRPYTIDNGGENIYINLTGIPEEELGDYLGEYTCIVRHNYHSVTGLYTFNIHNYSPEPVRATVADFWWLFLVIFLLLLILLLCICCCMYMKRNKGEGYPVDYYEKYNGNDPVEECKDADFHDYHRPIDFNTLKGSRASLGGSSQGLAESTGSSVYGYDNDATKFSEEGSFVGQYNTYNRPTISVPSHAVSNA